MSISLHLFPTSTQTQAGNTGGALIAVGILGSVVTCYILDRTRKFIFVMRGLLLGAAASITAVWADMLLVSLFTLLPLT